MKKIFAGIMSIVILLSSLPAFAVETDDFEIADEETAEYVTDISETEDVAEENTATSEIELPEDYGRASGSYFIAEDGLYDNNTLIDEGTITWLIEKNGVIYWSKLDGNNTDIYRKNISDNEITVLKRVFVPVEAFDVSGDELYYLYDGEITKVNVLTDEEESMGMIDGNAFYLDENDIKIISSKAETIGLNYENSMDNAQIQLFALNKSKISETTINKRINELCTWLEGKYFTLNENACNDSTFIYGHGDCDNCNNGQIAAKADWFKKQFNGKTISAAQYPLIHYFNDPSSRGVWSCAGFASFAEWYIFRTSDDSSVTTERIGVYAVKDVAKHAKVGDLLWMEYPHNENLNYHAGIYLGQNSSDSVYILNCNGDTNHGNCQVTCKNFKCSRVVISRATGQSKEPSITTGTETSTPNTTPTKPIPPVDKNVYINLTRAPGNGFKPQSFSLGGTISSAYPIYYLTAILTNVDTGEQLIHRDDTTNTRQYNIAGSTLDKAVKFSNIKKSGKYRLRIVATNSIGESKYIDHDFTAVVETPVSMPNVKVSSIEGGQRVTVSSSNTSLKLHMWSKLGEKSGNGTITMDFKKAGTYQVDGWSSNGSTASAKNSKTVSVKKMKTPQISSPSYGNSNATVTISGEGTIYYTTNGSAPTSKSTKYTGPISLTGNKTIKAVSIKNGCVNSDIASKDINVSKPDSPKVKLYNTKNKIAQGKTATVSWEKAARAKKYTATLYYNDEVVKTYSTKGTQASFALSKVGKYTIKVTADNFKGSSSESNSITVESMAPVTVTFVDRIDRVDGITDDTVSQIQQRVNEHDGENAELIEGNIISKQVIDYDTKPKKPATPSKKGFIFSGYGEGLYTTATENKTVYANYEVKYYTVDFYDTAMGEPTRIGETQEVMYTASAIPPQDYQMPAGYEFTGWSVDNSKSTGYDYTYVDGDIALQTAYAWANIDLPVFVEISKVIRDNKSYRIDLKLKNNPVEDTQGRIVVALYTSEGKNIYTQISEFDLDLGVQNNWTALDTITLLCTEKATYAKAFVVAVENDKTGGALSVAAECSNITYDTGSHFWSDWSDWSTTAVTASDSRIVEKKTQYRSQTKSTTTSTTTKKLSGWTYDSTKSTTGSWSSWSKTKVSAVNTDALKREVQSQNVAAVTHTQYRYGRYCNNYNIHPCPIYGASIDSRDTWYYNTSAWTDSAPKSILDTSVYLSCSGNHSHNSPDHTVGSSARWYRYWVNGGIYYFLDSTRQKTDTAAYTKYRYRDTTYVHSFYKWSAWSGWSDTKATATATKNVQTRTMYRYKTSGADDNEKESETLYRYHKTGNLDNITEDLSGDVATVMIYKKTNTDPTQEQIEYIDQITIGENNSYEINANTKEMLDYNNTGDFVVTLALEGGKKLVNVDLIKAEVPTYDVIFYDADGNQFGEIQKVRQGDGVDLNQIDIPTKEGYRFVKWNKSVVNVSNDLSVSPIFEPETFTVAFVDHENETTVLEEYNYGELIVLPMLENVEGKIFDGWEGVSDTDETIVTGSTVITAKWIPIKYHVTFCDFDGNPVGETQEVEYGEAAEMPDFVEKDGIAYSWDLTSGEWWNVTEDMTIRPYIPQIVDVSQPTISVPTEEAYGTFIAELDTENDENKIYYTIDASITEEEAKEYARQALLIGNESTIVLMSQETDVSENLENNEVDGFYSTMDLINEYTDPITVNEGSTVYAFAADSEGNVSPVSVFDYTYDWNTVDEGIVPNEYEPDPDAPQITMPTINANAGETVTVPVIIKNNMGIADLEMMLDYDTDDLVLESIENGEVFADNEFSYDVQDYSGIQLTWKSNSNNTKDGILMNLTFTVNNSANKSKYLLDLSAEYSGDANNEEWYFVTVPGALINNGTSSDDKGKKIITESVLNPDNKSLSVSVQSDSEYDGIMFVAVYNSSGVLEQLKQTSVNNIDEVYDIKFDQPVRPNQTIKVFVWKDTKSLLPLSDAETISVTDNLDM